MFAMAYNLPMFDHRLKRGGVTMIQKTKTKLKKENAPLRARQTKPEDKIANQSSGKGTLPRSDVTEHKRGEADPRQPGNLPVKQHASSVGVWDWNILTDEMTWSYGKYRILGLQPGEEKPTLELILKHVYPDDRLSYERSLREAVKTCALFQTENRIVRADGSIAIVISEGEVYLDANGKPVRVLGTVQDVTERKQIEEALKTSELRYRRLFETAKDGILLLDADTGIITDSNPYLENMLGYSHDELMGKALWEIGTFSNIAASKRAFLELQNNEYIRYDNLPLETKDKQRKQVEFVSNVYSANATKVIQCNIRDITERKLVEEELLATVIELQGHDSDMKVLNRMNDLLQTCTSQGEAYQVIATTASELFSGKSGSLAILHPWDQYLETVAHWGGEELVMPTFSLEDCWAMRRGQPFEVLDSKSALRCNHFIRKIETGYLCVPLTVQGETLGLLVVIGDTSEDAAQHVRQKQLAIMAGESIKLCLSNLRLREKLSEQAIHDPLTKLFNRRYLEESLPRELHRAKRLNHPLCVAMLDLDHFKRFNDTFGHEAGDVLLRELGQLLSAQMRKSDIPCRYGGEEFALVMPDSSLKNTLQRLNQVCLKVKTLEVRHSDQLLDKMTVSVGVAVTPKHGCTSSELLHAADEALYAAKKAGRDRVVIYQRKKSEDRNLSESEDRNLLGKVK
jgi:diguanylate cyclase (GGDEF)-like protein/PAS domain S-box-containing protein